MVDVMVDARLMCPIEPNDLSYTLDPVDLQSSMHTHSEGGRPRESAHRAYEVAPVIKFT